MKKQLLFITTALFLFVVSKISFAQTTIYFEDFNDNLASFDLNTTDLGCDASNANYWIINNVYASGFEPLIPATPDQVSGIIGFPQSTYLHITNGVFSENCTFNAPATGNVFTKMNAPISTIGFTNVSLDFWLISKGHNTNTTRYIGKTYYSIDGGLTWVQNPTTYSQISTWTHAAAITNPVFDNQADLRFAFMWVQNGGAGGQDPAFGLDDIKVQGTASSGNAITTGTISGSPFCAGANFSVPFTSTGTFNAGNIYTAQLSDANGSFAAPTSIGTLASTSLSGSISVTIPTGSTSGSGYIIRVISSNAAAIGSNSASITINSTVTPTVSILSDLGNSICTGSSVTFTASGTNTGASPIYSWTVDGSAAGTNSSTFASNTLTNGSVVQVSMTSNALCATPNSVNSNSISMIVTSSVTPAVSILSDLGNTICPGSSVTFTASGTNLGTSPIFSWTVDGIAAGTNSSTFTSNSLTNGSIVQVSMTSNALCASPSTASSNSISMVVTSSVTPSVAITSDLGSIICEGTSVLFTASPVGGGSSPVYSWTINGNAAGTNSNTFSTNSLVNGDIVQVTLTSNDACASIPTANSNSFSMTVNPSLPAAVSITSNNGTTICSGTSVTFTANGTNGGSSPTYSWTVNGNPVGTNSDTFTSNNLTDGSIVQVNFTSSDLCSSPSTVNSNSITMTISTTVTPSVTISSSNGSSVCSGSIITFSANPVNGGSSPSYSWTLNGNPIGTNTSSFTSQSITSDCVFGITMTSNDNCANGATATTTFPITVYPPSVLLTSSTPSSCGGGASGSVTVNITGGSPATSYLWDTNPVATTATVTNLAGGTYNVVVTYGNGCTVTGSATVASSGITLSSSVIVGQSTIDNPTGSISINVAGGQGPYSYLWSTNPVQVLNSATGLTAGSYSVIVTDATGCSTTFDFVVPSFVGIDDLTSENLEIYPNPTSNILFIKNNSSNSSINLTINDFSGKVLLKQGNLTNTIHQLDISEFSVGIYFLQISIDNRVINKKIIKM